MQIVTVISQVSWNLFSKTILCTSKSVSCLIPSHWECLIKQRACLNLGQSFGNDSCQWKNAIPCLLAKRAWCAPYFRCRYNTESPRKAPREPECLDTVILLLRCKANIFLLNDAHLFYHIGLLPYSHKSSSSSMAFKLKSYYHLRIFL